MEEKNHVPESNGNLIFVYKGKFKQNINSAGEKVRGEKKYRTAAIIAGSALVVLLTVMIICLVGVSSSIRARKAAMHAETPAEETVAAARQADSLAVSDTTKIQ